MSFEKHKKDFLGKTDKSNKGSIDKDIAHVIGLINSMPEFFTTSSCSGRIGLIKKPSEKKQDTEWMLKKHSKAGFVDIKKSLEKVPLEPVWFRQEPLIIHVCCRTMDDAKRLLDSARKKFKRAGIISLSKKIIIEIIGSEVIDTIVAKQGRMLISDDYLKALIEEANKKFDKGKKEIDELYVLLKNL